MISSLKKKNPDPSNTHSAPSNKARFAPPLPSPPHLCVFGFQFLLRLIWASRGEQRQRGEEGGEDPPPPLWEEGGEDPPCSGRVPPARPRRRQKWPRDNVAILREAHVDPPLGTAASEPPAGGKGALPSPETPRDEPSRAEPQRLLMSLSPPRCWAFFPFCFQAAERNRSLGKAWALTSGSDRPFPEAVYLKDHV